MVTGQFHRSISRLVKAGAVHTMAYLLTEARRIQDGCSLPELSRCARCPLQAHCREFIEAFQPDERRIIE